MTTRPTHTRAFSLTELLVVIGLIALLIALLLPALSGAWRSARSTVCKARLRECGVHLAMYANHNRGWLFPVGLGTDVPPEQRWPVHVFVPPVWNPPIMLCPEDVEPLEEHSYILNQHLAYRGVRYGRNSKVSASDVVVMGEKVSTRGDYYMEVLNNETEFLKVVELYRHGTVYGSNYLYLDLHVDSIAPRQTRDAIDPWDMPDVGPQTSPAGGT
jgi:hypothetical protein